MSTLRILIPEILGTQSGLATASSSASASLTDDNLLTPELWQKWRSTSAHPRRTELIGSINGDPTIAINAVALAGLNMVPGNGEVLAVLASGGLSLPPYERLAPSAIAASNLITGVVTDVDEDLTGASDGVFIKPTHATTSFVTFDFGTPAASPRTGARRQCFLLNVKAINDTSGALAYARPSVTVKLYENVAGTPTLRASLGTKTVHGTAAHLLFFSWDASLLATANGSNVQVRVEFTQGATSTDAWLDGIEWHCESDQITGLFPIAESGWSTVLANPTSGVGYDYSTQAGDYSTRWAYKFSQVYQPARVYVFLREDHVPVETSTSFNRLMLRPPVGYVQAGKLCAGLWWEPAINRAQGAFATVLDRSSVVEDDGGSRWGVRRESIDEYRIVLEWLTEQEMAWLKHRLLHELGTLVPFYIELEADATFELGFGGWVTLASTQNVVSRRNTDTYTYSMEFTVRVKR